MHLAIVAVSSHRGCIKPSRLHQAIAAASSHRGCIKPSWLHQAIVAASSKPLWLHQASHRGSRPSTSAYAELRKAELRCAWIASSVDARLIGDVEDPAEEVDDRGCIKPSWLQSAHQAIVAAAHALCGRGCSPCIKPSSLRFMHLAIVAASSHHGCGPCIKPSSCVKPSWLRPMCRDFDSATRLHR